MNIISYLQDRQYGLASHRSRKFKLDQLDQFLDEKTADSFVDMPCSVSGSCRSTFLMEFSPDGTKIASAHGDHTVRVTDIASGQCVRTLQGHPRTPWCLAYHPSSNHILASGCLGGQVRIWDLYGYGCEVWQTENSNVIASLTFHPTDHVLVIAAGNSIYFWDWGKPEPFAKCSTLHEYERIRWIQFDGLGHHLFTGISNNTSVHRDEVSSVSLSSQGQNSGPRQPSHLSSVYSRIINCYQDYRRDRLAQETNSAVDEREQSNQPFTDNTGEDLYPGVRDIDIVEPRASPPLSSQHVDSSRIGVYANNVSNQITHLSSNAQQNFIRTTARNSFSGLINPRNDPFLSPGPSRSIFVTPTSSNTNPTESNPLPVSISSGNSLYDRLLRRRQASRDLIGDNMGSSNLTNYSTSSVIDSVNTASSTSSTTATISQTASSSHLPDSVETLSESIRTSITSCRDVNPYLARYLKNQKLKKTSRSSTVSQTSKPFASIRDRLKTSLQLSCESRKSSSASVNNPQGIPPVTILPALDSYKPASVQSNLGTGSPNISVVYSHQPEQTSSSSGLLPGSSVKDRSQSSSVHRDDTLNTPLFKSSIQNRMQVGDRKVKDNNSSALSSSSTDSRCDSSTDRSAKNDGNVPWTDSAFSLLNRPHGSSLEYYQTHKGEWERRRARRQKPYQVQSGDLSNIQPYTNTRGLPGPCTPSSTHQETINSVIDNVLCGGDRALMEGRKALRAGAAVIREGERVLREGDRALNNPVLGIQDNEQNHLNGSEEAIQQKTGLPTQDSVENESAVNTNENRPGCYSLSITESSNASASLPNSNPKENLASYQPKDRMASYNIVQAEGSGANNQPKVSMISQQTIQTEGSSTTNQPIVGTSSNTVQTESSYATNQPIELVVDQNENYTAVRNANRMQSTPSGNEVQVHTNDDNNNSLHFVEQNNTVITTTADITPTTNPDNLDQNYMSLRNTFVSMTGQIEREMSDLNRRINALRDSFNQNLFSLRQDRQRYENVGGEGNSRALTHSSGIDNSQSETDDEESRNIQVIVTSPEDQQSSENEQENDVEFSDTHGFMIQPPTLLETSLRSHRRRQHQLLQRPPPQSETAGEPQDWRQLQRHFLHPHYSSSIFDETINRPSNAIQSAINRAIAGAFMGTGESALANNIINQTHRIQYWDFTKCDIPDITNSNKNIVVPHCKLHNSASCDIAQNGSLLATFVPSHHGFPDDNILAVYSLLPDNRGQCLYTKSFGPNAISISISPSNNFILVGLAAKKLSWVFSANQIVAQIYRLERKEAGERSTKLVKDIYHSCNGNIRTHVSGNSARWLPVLGQGLVYGTNRGHLIICKPGEEVPVKNVGSLEIVADDQHRFILRRVPRLTHSDPHRVSASTQTQRTRQTAATQTETDARTSH